MEEKRLRNATLLAEDGDGKININFTEDNGFFVENTNVSGIVLEATDDLLEPDVPKTSKVLVNTNVDYFNGNGLYVFRNPMNPESFDIAFLRQLEDGRYEYVYDRHQPQIIPSLSGLSFIGRVWDLMVPCEVEQYETKEKVKVFLFTRTFSKGREPMFCPFEQTEIKTDFSLN